MPAGAWPPRGGGPRARRLGWEAKRLRAAGTEVVLIQPLGEDLAAMGPNLMRRQGVARVVEVARRTTVEQLDGGETSNTLRELGRAQRSSGLAARGSG